MASIDDVARIAAALPGAKEGTRCGRRTWSVGGKGFVWERPFSKADLTRFGDVAPPPGPIAALSVEDLGEKEALLAAHRGVFFTIPHFDGYPAVLVELDKASPELLREAILDAWLVHAPRDVAEEHLRERG
jgi:hypothetical protein